MEPRVNFITLGTDNLAAARRFYVDGLDWRPAFEVPDEVMFIQVGPGLLLSLWKSRELDADIGDGSRANGAPSPLALSRNVASDDEVRTVIERVRAAGWNHLVRAADRRLRWVPRVLREPSRRTLPVDVR